MKLLFCCEFYHPSRGGVQEVMRQIAERMVARGHDVTVATTRLAARNFDVWNGVKIKEFDISGNLARGLTGKVDLYRQFVVDFPADAIMIKAAQQWTFDALLPVLDHIKARKVFIPCGFSGLFNPAFEDYFHDLPAALAKFDHLIFYAERYRDIDFARQHGLQKFSIIPNGASDFEFEAPADPTFRERMGIGADDFVVMTVGTPVGAKGHVELAEAFARLTVGERPVTLVLNGHWRLDQPGTLLSRLSNAAQVLRRALSVLAANGPATFVRRIQRSLEFRTAVVRGRVADRLRLRRFRNAAAPAGGQSAENTATAEAFAARGEQAVRLIDQWTAEAVRDPRKRVLTTELPREDVINLFRTANLFVFASHIEYSPLVLFEAAAAGLPFLSVPVGNAEEIVRWTGGGVICPAPRDAAGYTRVDPAVLALEIKRCMREPELLAQLATAGRDAWQRKFNWASIAARYERVLQGVHDKANTA